MRWCGGVFLAALLGCQAPAGVPAGDPASKQQVRVTVCFQPADHVLDQCMPGLARSLEAMPDGVLFFDADSRVRVKVPADAEPYHAHIRHRVGGHVVQATVEGARGEIVIDLSRYPQPEHLTVTSASHEVSGRMAGREERAVLPPFTLSFRLVLASQADAHMAVQPFRYELETPVGSVRFFVQPLNRGDMLLTLVDAERKFSRLFGETYVWSRALDAYVFPRLVLEVEGKDGALWQRAGAWPVPRAETRGSSADGPLALRTARRELIGFREPVGVTLTMPKDRPEVATSVLVSVSGPRAGEQYRIVVAHAVPQERSGAPPRFQVQWHQLDTTWPRQSCGVDISKVDAERFPMTATVAHRFIQPWKAPGGYLPVEPPLGVTRVSGGEGGIPTGHKNVIVATSAAYYDLLTFAGKGGKVERDWVASGALASMTGPSSSIVPPGVTTPPGAGTTPGVLLPGMGSGVGFVGWTPATGVNMPGGGGPPTSSCRCGTNGSRCPSSSNPCAGTCGAGCACQPDSAGTIKVKFSCRCGMGRDKCKCQPHQWNMADAMQSISSLFPGAADVSWFGPHGGSAPCHRETMVAIVRASHWQGIRLVDRWYRIFVTFEPCAPQPAQCNCGLDGANCPAATRCNGKCANCACEAPKKFCKCGDGGAACPKSPKCDGKCGACQCHAELGGGGKKGVIEDSEEEKKPPPPLGEPVPTEDPRDKEGEVSEDVELAETGTNSSIFEAGPLNDPGATDRLTRLLATRFTGFRSAQLISVPVDLLAGLRPAGRVAADVNAYWKRAASRAPGTEESDRDPLLWEWTIPAAGQEHAVEGPVPPPIPDPELIGK